MSVFEAFMLMCFGVSWPFAVIKTYRTKNVKGKSARFISLILLGYIFGIIHKVTFSYDIILILYIFNALLVFADLVMYFKYKNNA